MDSCREWAVTGLLKSILTTPTWSLAWLYMCLHSVEGFPSVVHWASKDSIARKYAWEDVYSGKYPQQKQQAGCSQFGV